MSSDKVVLQIKTFQKTTVEAKMDGGQSGFGEREKAGSWVAMQPQVLLARHRQLLCDSSSSRHPRGVFEGKGWAYDT